MDFCGTTGYGTTNWVYYSGSGFYVDVDTSSAGFENPPVYIAALGGDSSHWTSKGASSIYTKTATGFRIYINTDQTMQFAIDNNWHINWYGCDPNVNHYCHDEHDEWVQYNSDGIYMDVDTGRGYFSQTPVYFSNI
eukprot:UN29118